MRFQPPQLSARSTYLSKLRYTFSWPRLSSVSPAHGHSMLSSNTFKVAARAQFKERASSSTRRSQTDVKRRAHLQALRAQWTGGLAQLLLGLESATTADVPRRVQRRRQLDLLTAETLPRVADSTSTTLMRAAAIVPVALKHTGACLIYTAFHLWFTAGHARQAPH